MSIYFRFINFVPHYVSTDWEQVVKKGTASNHDYFVLYVINHLTNLLFCVIFKN